MVASHNPCPGPGSRPSLMMFASVMLNDDDPLKGRLASASRFSTTTTEDNRSPYLAPKPPANSSNRPTVSGLNALVRPNRRYGL